jgi:S-adenosylmethionine:tRNA ribosyltransferase-isomerase
MKLSDFDYQLPERLIAQSPLAQRDHARLMVIDRASGRISHDRFFNLGRHLPARSFLVVNNSRVIPARLFGVKERNQGNVEVFLLKSLPDGYSYEVLMRPMRRIKDGDVFLFNAGSARAEVIDKEQRIIRFNRRDLRRHLGKIGHVPLPPYIKRRDTRQDKEDYQTVYARYAGSVAAPTAGLHFTKRLLESLKADGHQVLPVLLHINYGTFKPVEREDIREHQMHSERYAVSRRVDESLKDGKRQGRKIGAVGTTSCRALESSALTGRLRGETRLFIYPGFRFQRVDFLISNFHLPLSSLLMLVYAFGGQTLMRRAYREAVEQEYRFYSYGDAMLII